MKAEHLAIVKGHYQVREKMVREIETLRSILREYREVIEQMDQIIRRKEIK